MAVGWVEVEKDDVVSTPCNPLSAVKITQGSLAPAVVRHVAFKTVWRGARRWSLSPIQRLKPVRSKYTVHAG
jgi:hypothetical protein